VPSVCEKIEVNPGRAAYVENTQIQRIYENNEHDRFEAMRSVPTAYTQFEHELTLRHTIKLFPRALLFCFMLSLAIILEGYECVAGAVPLLPGSSFAFQSVYYLSSADLDPIPSYNVRVALLLHA
jgi:hypothetical protein